MQHMN